MARYSHEPDNATKSCKARGSNLRVHFKVLFMTVSLISVVFKFVWLLLIILVCDLPRIQEKQLRQSGLCLSEEPSGTSRMWWSLRSVSHSGGLMVALGGVLRFVIHFCSIDFTYFEDITRRYVFVNICSYVFPDMLIEKVKKIGFKQYKLRHSIASYELISNYLWGCSTKMRGKVV